MELSLLNFAHSTDSSSRWTQASNLTRHLSTAASNFSGKFGVRMAEMVTQSSFSS
jgi:hypothetical protein